MTLKTYKLGDLVERSTVNNKEQKYGMDLIEGVNTQGVFAPPKGNPIEVNLKPYKIVKDGAFVYNPTRLELGSIAYRTNGLCRVSHLYQVFYLNEKGKKLIDPTYLFIYFRRKEFCREVTFRNFGSQRPEFSIKDMCDLYITLPDIMVQQKYVQIYESMVANQKSYEQGLDDLKLTCDAYLDKLKKECDKQDIGKYIAPCDLRNESEKLTIENLRGMSTEKKFINTKADMMDVSLKNYKIVKQNEFVYVADTSRRGDIIALGFNDSNENILVSSIYTVFKIIDTNAIDPHYLMMFFTRNEFDRYARFNSWGSARETFDWSEMCSVKIPIPDIKVQRAIADIYKVYTERKRINEQLKQQIKDICPILIKGSLEE